MPVLIPCSEELDRCQKGVDMVNLKGKVAVVTGASHGVGKGIALGLGEAGATVYITGRTTQEGADVDKLVRILMAGNPDHKQSKISSYGDCH